MVPAHPAGRGAVRAGSIISASEPTVSAAGSAPAAVLLGPDAVALLTEAYRYATASGERQYV